MAAPTEGVRTISHQEMDILVRILYGEIGTKAQRNALIRIIKANTSQDIPISERLIKKLNSQLSAKSQIALPAPTNFV